jgi:hypothetical protein
MWACSGGIGCGNCAANYTYPSSGLQNGAQPVDDGFRFRMTQSALDFLSIHLKDILIGAFAADPNNPDLVRIELPGAIPLASGSIYDITLGEGPNETYPTTVLLDAQDLADSIVMQFIQGGQEGIYVRMENIPIGIDARGFAEVDLALFTATAACDIDGGNTDGIVTDLSIEMTIRPDVGTGSLCDPGVPECLLIDIEVDQVDLGNISASDLDIDVPPQDDNNCNSSPDPLCSPECSDPVVVVDSSGDTECVAACGTVDFAADIVLSIAGVLENLLGPLLDNAFELAIRNALQDIDGAPLIMSDKLSLQGLGEGILKPTIHDIGYMVGPTGNAFDVNDPPAGAPTTGPCSTPTCGMDFTMKTGLEPSQNPVEEYGIPHPCVPPKLGTDFAELYGSFEFEAPTTTPLTGEYEGAPYHYGASMAEAAMNQGLFGLYHAGVLCIEVDSEDVYIMTSGAFPLSAGSLDLLTEGRLRQFVPPSAPALITIAPSKPPIIEMGKGNAEEGHIQVSWEQVEISFYVFMHERYARVFAVKTDIFVGLSLFNDPDEGVLRMAIVQGPDVDNFDQNYNELIPEVNFEEILETLVGLAMDAALGNGLEFDYNIADALSDMLGVPLWIEVSAIETVGANPDDLDFLNVYLSLSDTDPQTQVPPVQARFEMDPLPGLYDIAERPERPSGEITLPTGEVTLQLAQATSNAELQAFAQVDFGLWRGPLAVEDGVVTIADPKLKLVGKHDIRIRVREKHNWSTLERYPTHHSIWVDPYPPTAELELTGEGVVARATDLGTWNPDDLQVAWRVDDEAFGAFSAHTLLPLEELRGARKVSVQVRDLAGNLSKRITLDLQTRVHRDRIARLELEEQLQAPPSAMGCAQARGGLSALGPFALIFGALGALRRRRQSRI